MEKRNVKEILLTRSNVDELSFLGVLKGLNFCGANFSAPNNGWILVNVETMPKILRYFITSKLLLSNVRFWAPFGC